MVVSMIPIADLEPHASPPTDTGIHAVVSLCWPYSSSTRQCALLLVDPDFRLRNREGQIRVRFTGPTAAAVAQARIGIGDEVVLELRGAVWEGEVGSRVATPGKSVAGELMYRGRLGLHVKRKDGDDIKLEVNEDTPPYSPDMQDVRRQELRGELSGSRKQPSPTLPESIFASPAFVKNVKSASDFHPGGLYDPFVDLDDDDPHERRSKRQRTSFGEVKKWRYAEQSAPFGSESDGEDDMHVEQDESDDATLSPSKMLQAQQLAATFDHEPKVRDFQPAMPPSALPRLHITSGPQDALVSSPQEDEPTTPKLQPVSSSSLPLPSPFPVDTLHMHSHANGLAFLPSQSFSEPTNLHVNDVGLPLTTDPIEAHTQHIEQNFERSTPDHGDNDDQRMFDDDDDDDDNDTISYEHPEYMSDTEEDDELYAEHLATQRLSPSSDEGARSHSGRLQEPIHSEGEAENAASLHRDSEHKAIAREPDEFAAATAVSADATPRTPTRPIVIGFGYDGASSATPPQQRSTPQVERERIMKQTYKSLFGFRASPSPTDTYQQQHPGRNMADGTTSTAEEVNATTNVSPAPPQESGEGSEFPDALQGGSNHYPWEEQVIDISSGSGDHEEDEDLEPQLEVVADTETSRIVELRSTHGMHDRPLDVSREQTFMQTSPTQVEAGPEHLQSFTSLDETGEHMVSRWIHDLADASAPEARGSFLSETTIASETLPPTQVPSFAERGNVEVVEAAEDTPEKKSDNTAAADPRDELRHLAGESPGYEQQADADLSHAIVRPHTALEHGSLPEMRAEDKFDAGTIDLSSHDPHEGEVQSIARSTAEPDKSGSTNDIVSSSAPRSAARDTREPSTGILAMPHMEALTQGQLMQDLGESEAAISHPSAMSRASNYLGPAEMLEKDDSLSVMEVIDFEGSATFPGPDHTIEINDAQHQMLLDPQLSGEVDQVDQGATVLEQEHETDRKFHRDDEVKASTPELPARDPAHQSVSSVVASQAQIAPPLQLPGSLETERQPASIRSTSRLIPGEPSANTPPRSAEPIDNAALSEIAQTTPVVRRSSRRSSVHDGLRHEGVVASSAPGVHPLTSPSERRVTRSTRSQRKDSDEPGSENMEHDAIRVAPTLSTRETRSKRKLSVDQDLAASATPPAGIAKGARGEKSFTSRLSQVPEAISAWFSPRRSARLHPQLGEDGNATGEGQAGKAAASAMQGVQGAEVEQQSSRVVRVGGTTTTLAYFTPLTDLEQRLNAPSQPSGSNMVDVLAVVTDETKAPERAKSGPKDYLTVFQVTDANLAAMSSVRVDVFRPWHAKLPVAKAGDVVLLRSFAVKSRKRQPYLLSTDASAWCVWRYSDSDVRAGLGRSTGGSISGVREEVKGPPVELGEGERARAEELRRWWESSRSEETAAAAPVESTRELRNGKRREGKL